MSYWILMILTGAIVYCFGSLSSVNVASSYIFRRNLRRLGQGNKGLSNFRRIYGVKGAIKLVLVELVKDIVPLIIGGVLLGIIELKEVGRAYAGFCLTLGALYPVFNRFRGAHAVFPLIISAFFADSTVGIATLAVVAMVIWFSKYVSLGTVAGALMFAGFSVIQVDDGTVRLLCLLTGLIVVIKHVPAMLRLFRHKELKLSFVEDISYKFDQSF